jgi:hypothetical protein
MQIIHSTDHLTSQTNLESEISAGKALATTIYLDKISVLIYNLNSYYNGIGKNVSQEKG